MFACINKRDNSTKAYKKIDGEKLLNEFYTNTDMFLIKFIHYLFTFSYQSWSLPVNIDTIILNFFSSFLQQSNRVRFADGSGPIFTEKIVDDNIILNL